MICCVKHENAMETMRYALVRRRCFSLSMDVLFPDSQHCFRVPTANIIRPTVVGYTTHHGGLYNSPPWVVQPTIVGRRIYACERGNIWWMQYAIPCVCRDVFSLAKASWPLRPIRSAGLFQCCCVSLEQEEEFFPKKVIPLQRQKKKKCSLKFYDKPYIVTN